MTNLPTHRDDTHLLAQRFVDQELTADERESFADRIGRDGGLRRRVIALQGVAAAGSRLARPTVSAAFVAGVLERTAAVTERPARASRLAWLWTPHTMQWNLAQAAAVVVLAVARGLAWRATIDSRRAGTTSAAAGAPTPVMVRLVVLQPDARSVNAVGDFNGWDPARTSLQQVSSGVWSVTLPLEPGPLRVHVRGRRPTLGGRSCRHRAGDDGFGSRNAVLEVLPPGAPL